MSHVKDTVHMSLVSYDHVPLVPLLAFRGLFVFRAPTSLAAVVKVIRDAQLSSYGACANYAMVRFARALVIAIGKGFRDTESDWGACRGMSRNVLRRFDELGLRTWGAALSARDTMRRHLGMPSYTLCDLTCYVCLSSKVVED